LDNKPRVKNKRKDLDEIGDVYIGRPSKWGNPFTHINDRYTKANFIVATRNDAIEAYKKWFMKAEQKHLRDQLHELRGKNLVCWCAPLACHGDFLIKMANQEEMRIQGEHD
jgi:hypothetical protein